jgi:hypothetical protein
MFSGDLSHARAMCPNQRGKASTTVKLKCLEEVKMYGKSPKKLFKAIKIKRPKHKKVPPGVNKLPEIAENSELTNRTTRRNKVVI